MQIDSACAFSAEAVTKAGGWYTFELRVLRAGQPLSTYSVAHVGVGEVFILAGQSNATNYGEARTQTASGMVVSFDGTTWAIASDPQPGPPDKSTRGSLVPSFGDAMYANYNVPIAVASVGHAGTSVRQ